MTNEQKLNLIKNFKKMSKTKAYFYFEQLLASDNLYLSDCYKNYSRAKQNAYDDAINLYSLLGGYDFRIITYNWNAFTCGYLFDTDENTYIIVHTHNHDYIGIIA